MASHLSRPTALAYVLGALEDADRAVVEAHVTTCAVCADSLALLVAEHDALGRRLESYANRARPTRASDWVNVAPRLVVRPTGARGWLAIRLAASGVGGIALTVLVVAGFAAAAGVAALPPVRRVVRDVIHRVDVNLTRATVTPTASAAPTASATPAGTGSGLRDGDRSGAESGDVQRERRPDAGPNAPGPRATGSTTAIPQPAGAQTAMPGYPAPGGMGGTPSHREGGMPGRDGDNRGGMGPPGGNPPGNPDPGPPGGNPPGNPDPGPPGGNPPGNPDPGPPGGSPPGNPDPGPPGHEPPGQPHPGPPGRNPPGHPHPGPRGDDPPDHPP